MSVSEWQRLELSSWSGAYEEEHATSLYFCNGVFIDRFIFKSNLLRMRLPWKCHSQSQDTNWRHCVNGPVLAFFLKRKGVPKIDQSIKMPWHRLGMGVAGSSSSAPVVIKKFFLSPRENFPCCWCSASGETHLQLRPTARVYELK